MKILFVDESRKKQQNIHFLCLCGVIIDGENINLLEKELKNFKRKMKFDNFKDFRKPADKDEKSKNTKILYEILEKYDVKVISAVIMGKTLEEIKRKEKNFETYHRFKTLKFILERYNIIVSKNKTTGLVLFDSLNKKIEKQMSDLFFELKGKKFNNIYKSLLFTKDDYSNILQITDLIGVSLNSAIYKSLEKKKIIDRDNLQTYNEYLEIYWPLFEKNPLGSVDGWGLKIWY